MNLIDIELLIVLALFVIMTQQSIFGGGKSSSQRNIIKTETSSFLKALCSIVIVCHHYSLRSDGEMIRRLFAIGGGTYALIIFLLLSSYGVAKSDQRYHLSLLQFFKKRICKLFKPYLLVTISFMVVYYVVGSNALSVELIDNRVSQAFVDLGRHSSSFIDCIFYVIGVKTFDAAMWYVGVTLFSYLAFGIAKTLSCSILKKNEMHKLLLTQISYAIFIVLFALVTYNLKFPAHYYRNLWALVLGLCISSNEKMIQEWSLSKKVIAMVAVNGIMYFWLWITNSGNFNYMIFANVALLSIWMSNKLFNRYSYKQKNCIVFIAGISYFVYLIHVKVLTLEWWYWGYKSLLLPLAVIFLLSYVFSKLSSKI